MSYGSSELSINHINRTLHHLDIVYFPNLKTYLRGTRINYKAEISHAIQKYNRPLNRAWFMHVYTEIGETLL